MQLFKVAYLEGPDFTSHIIDILLNRNDIFLQFSNKKYLKYYIAVNRYVLIKV